MSITPTADMMIDQRRVGPPVRLTPDAGPQAGIIERGGAGQATAAVGEAADEGYSFWDLLDVINPLQHIPVVSSIYRELTGDEIRAPAKLAGGALFGGVVGLAASAMDVILKEVSGRDAGEHMVALFDGASEDADPQSPILLADSAPDAAPDAPTAGAPAAAVAAAAGTASAPPAVAAEGARWFSINRDQHVRAGVAAPEPVREAMMRRGGPTVEVTSPRPDPAASLPLGVMSAASAASAAVPRDAAPPPDAVRRALAAQGLQPRDDHAMLRAAVPPVPASAATVTVPVSMPAAAPPPAGGPVDVPAWFDKAMRKYGASDSLAPDSPLPAMPIAAPVDRRGV